MFFSNFGNPATINTTLARILSEEVQTSVAFLRSSRYGKIR
jgi:hypothetical protein